MEKIDDRAVSWNHLQLQTGKIDFSYLQIDFSKSKKEKSCI